MSNYKITRINICGFPMSACGHSYILLYSSEKCCLAHLTIQVPEQLSPTGRIPPWQYYPYYFFSNKLSTKITCWNNAKGIKDKLQKVSNSSLRFNVVTWFLDGKGTFDLVYTIMQQQSVENEHDNFCVYGQEIGFLAGGGSNCMNWADDILRQTHVSGPGQPLNLDVLLRSLSS